MPTADGAAIERAYRESSGRAIATLVCLFGDIDLAEEAVQEAFAVAAKRWPAMGSRPTRAGVDPPRAREPGGAAAGRRPAAGGGAGA